MSVLEEYGKFVKAEGREERLSALEAIVSSAESRLGNISVWQALSQITAAKERAHLASATKMSVRPSSSWALLSTLFQEIDHDIIGNAINGMTFSKNRALGHRIVPFSLLPERPQRVLYCMTRFAEETIDRRFSDSVASTLDFDVSEALLARAFNALFRLGVRHPRAVEVASALVRSHVDATNMDRKAAVSAILYLCFAGSRNDIKALSDVRDRVSIPELRRLLSWGLQEIFSIGSKSFSSSDAVVFFERAVSHGEPNFSGYGCFEPDALIEGFQKFLGLQKPAQRFEIVRLVLNLGEKNCIEAVASHPDFGIDAAITSDDQRVISLWRAHCPIHSEVFSESILSKDRYDVWHKDNPEMLFMNLRVSDWCSPKGNKPWQVFFEKMLVSRPEVACDVFCAQILSVEREIVSNNSAAIVSEEIKRVLLANLDKLLTESSGEKCKLSRLQIGERVHAILIAGLLPVDFADMLSEKLGPIRHTWVPLALGMHATQTSGANRMRHLTDCIASLDDPIQDFDCEQNEYVFQICSILMAAILYIEANPSDLDPIMVSMDLTCQKIQAILDALGESSGDGEEIDEEVADWAGHVSVDKPILRWNAVAQAIAGVLCAERPEFEGILKEALRMASHVEKRWVIRALVRLNSEDSVKAILYQAFQHIDTDFVGLTIRELLKSRHPRAQQALIRAVGRSTVSDEMKQLILDDISIENPLEIMRELKTLELLRLPQQIDDAVREAVGRVASLIDSSTIEHDEAKEEKASIADVDGIITEFLPGAERLSVDTRSALRTAEMILIQSQAWGNDAVDLSPIVNMHCKAVELAMREIFEPWTDALMRQGLLSRKLDILGYARPIPEKMQLFEDFLASLPVIKSIPYFSRFKLRKMLRAICLYRPGKRFTLDGPKAFALLLLVVSRKACQFGLANVLNVGFRNDMELFEFIKLVHSLQDSRNRAVHEGLTWEAKDDIESMRSQAYQIIEFTQKAGDYLSSNGGGLKERGAHGA